MYNDEDNERRNNMYKERRTDNMYNDQKTRTNNMNEGRRTICTMIRRQGTKDRQYVQ